MIVRKRNWGANPHLQHDVNSYEELIQIDWIKETWLDHGYTLAYSPREYEEYDDKLMVVKGKGYFVTGFIAGDGSQLGLKPYLTLVEK